MIDMGALQGPAKFKLKFKIFSLNLMITHNIIINFTLLLNDNTTPTYQ